MNKEKQNKINRENMVKKRALLKANAKSGDREAIREYNDYLAYHRNKTAESLSELRSQANNGDKAAVARLDLKKHDGITNLIISFIKNKANTNQLDELEKLVKQRKNVLTSEAIKKNEL